MIHKFSHRSLPFAYLFRPRHSYHLASLLALLCLFAFLPQQAVAQNNRAGGVFGRKLVDVSLGQVTLEAADLRDQTARLNIGLDVTNAVLPVQIKDFDYRLSFFGGEIIEGSHTGTMRIGGSKRPSRVNLPVTVNLRAIPQTLWSAFRSNGRVRYDLDTAFTIPLYITERRFEQSFAGEVPLRSIVDAATILRAQRSGDSRSGGLFGLPW